MIIRILLLTITLLIIVPQTFGAKYPPTPPKLYEAKIISVKEVKNSLNKLTNTTTQEIYFEFVEGPDSGKRLKIKNSVLPSSLSDNLKKGDRVIISKSTEINGDIYYQITDYVRKDKLILLFAIFIIAVIVVGRLQGILSFVGMLISFYAIMNIVLPQILKGVNPVFITLAGSLVIIPVTFFLAHGLNKKTLISIVSTFLTLAITGGLAAIFLNISRITGYALEEAVFVEAMTDGAVNIKNLLLAGIIIGAMGILDDITISQTSIVERLSIANPKFSFGELYFHAMKVGKDHIASLVNTLILVYAGASLPLFVLFSQSKLSLGSVINQEIIASEIVRTLVSSIGIISAVPITTILACFFFKRSKS